MIPFRIAPITCALVGGLLGAQTHTHPAVNSNHNHRNNQIRQLNFGIFSRATGAIGRITMPASGLYVQPVLSGVSGGTFTLLNGLSAGPAAYYIDLQTYDGDETIWESRSRASFSRAVTLTGSSGGTLVCNLDARSSPFRGNYPFPHSATMRSENFYWGGYINLTNGNQPAGIYTGNTSSLNIQDTNFDGTFNGFVGTEDWCSHNQDYGTSNEAPNFEIRVELRTPPPALSVVPNSSMHFGTFLRPIAAGTATINPSTGVRTVTGGLVGRDVNVAPLPRRAQYNLSGGQNLYVQFVTPSSATLTNAGGATMSVTFPAGSWAVTGGNGSGTGGQVDSTGYVRLSNTNPGTATFWLGGTLAVGANQAGGDYTGTYTITFAYR